MFRKTAQLLSFKIHVEVKCKMLGHKLTHIGKREVITRRVIVVDLFCIIRARGNGQESNGSQE